MTIARITGIDALRANFLSFPEELAKKALNQALRKAAKPIVDAASARAPKKTGKLAATISAVVDKKPYMAGMDARVIVYVPWKGAQAAIYWRYQEFGTSKIVPHPFMRPAFDSNTQAALTIIFQSLSDAVPRIAATLRK